MLDTDRPFGEPRALGVFPAGAPFRYDRVVVGDDHVFVGVPQDPKREDDPGSVAVHARSADGSWAPDVIRPPSGGVAAFGEHLALDGPTLAVTADRRDPATGAREAVVFLYERTANDGWRADAVLLEGEGVPPGTLTLALRNDLLAIGTRPSFSSWGGGGAGPPVGTAVRLFERGAGGANGWQEIDAIVGPDRGDGRQGAFGADVASSPDASLLAVADTAQTSDAGFGTLVFLYERSAAGEGWKPIRTFRDDELPSPYSAMLDLDGDTLAVTPMAARETTSVEVAIFVRDADGPNGWGRAATVEVDVATPPGDALPRHVLLSTDLVDGVLAVGIGPSACIDLRPEPGPEPAPCAGGRIHLISANDAGRWEVRTVIDDPTGTARSSYGEYVAMAPDGETLVAGGTVFTPEGSTYVHLDVYERDREDREP